MPTPEKAYDNSAFLHSEAARYLRVLCEYEEPKQRFLAQHVQHTIVFFGSARIHSAEVAQAQLAAAQSTGEIAHAHQALNLSRYYEQARQLARMLTAWSMERGGAHYYICSGAGPGIMEAANRGAAEVPGGQSIGLGISLPLEQSVNAYVTPELAFEFHYFFTRKYWFLNLCKALIIFPGGFGTLDELFETVTLAQTNKIPGKMPIVLFGSDYWDQVINLKAMVNLGTISAADLDLIHPANTVEEAFAYITLALAEQEQVG